MTNGDAAFICELRGTRTMFDAAHAGPDGRLRSSRIDLCRVGVASSDGWHGACSDTEHDALGSRMLLSLRTGDATSTGGSRNSQRCRDEV